MPSAAGLADLLADLAATLTTLRTPWYVFGAQAALIWGRPRLTTDVDAIRDTLAMVEGALGQSDLRPLFETEFARWQSRR